MQPSFWQDKQLLFPKNLLALQEAEFIPIFRDKKNPRLVSGDLSCSFLSDHDEDEDGE
jgi:hypothetical protein